MQIPICCYSNLLRVSIKKDIERTFFVSAGTQKGWEMGSGNT